MTNSKYVDRLELLLCTRGQKEFPASHQTPINYITSLSSVDSYVDTVRN